MTDPFWGSLHSKRQQPVNVHTWLGIARRLWEARQARCRRQGGPLWSDLALSPTWVGIWRVRAATSRMPRSWFPLWERERCSKRNAALPPKWKAPPSRLGLRSSLGARGWTLFKIVFLSVSLLCFFRYAHGSKAVKDTFWWWDNCPMVIYFGVFCGVQKLMYWGEAM